MVEKYLLTHRLGWIMMHEQGIGGSEIARRCDISRHTLYKWLKRYKASGNNPNSLIDRPRSPHTSPKATSPELIEKIITIRKETGKGCVYVSKKLFEETGVMVSAHTVWKYLRRNKLMQSENNSEAI